jgi:hypothetical protein
MENKAEGFSRTAIHFTPAPESASSEKRAQRRQADEYLDKALRPTADRIKEERRVTGLMYDAAAKGDRAQFHKLFQDFTAMKSRQASSAPTLNAPPAKTPSTIRPGSSTTS